MRLSYGTPFFSLRNLNVGRSYQHVSGMQEHHGLSGHRCARRIPGPTITRLSTPHR